MSSDVFVDRDSVVFPDTDEEFPQEHDELVPGALWWWATHIALSVVAVVANFVFLLTVIYSRRRRDLQTFVSGVIITISVLDVIDVLRIIPVLVRTVFLERIFRHVYCSLGVFHELSIAIFLVILSIGVCIRSGKNNKYQLAGGGGGGHISSPSGWAHKLVVPLVLLAAAGASAPFFLLPYDRLGHACVDPTAFKAVMDYDSERFPANVYATAVTLFTYVLPILLMPLLLPIALFRTCLARQCCVGRYKQPIGETLMVLAMGAVYIATLVFVVLPSLDKMLDVEALDLGPVPLLWELGNNAVRPFIYFLLNPAVWDATRAMCCGSKAANNNGLNHENAADEIEVPLSPVTTV